VTNDLEKLRNFKEKIEKDFPYFDCGIDEKDEDFLYVNLVGTNTKILIVQSLKDKSWGISLADEFNTSDIFNIRHDWVFTNEDVAWQKIESLLDFLRELIDS